MRKYQPNKDFLLVQWIVVAWIVFVTIGIVTGFFRISNNHGKVANTQYQKIAAIKSSMFNDAALESSVQSQIVKDNSIIEISNKIIKCANESNFKAGIKALNFTDQFVSKFREDLHPAAYGKDIQRGSNYLIDVAGTFCSVILGEDVIAARIKNPSINIFESLINVHISWWDLQESQYQISNQMSSLLTYQQDVFLYLTLISVFLIISLLGFVAAIKWMRSVSLHLCECNDLDDAKSENVDINHETTPDPVIRIGFSDN